MSENQNFLAGLGEKTPGKLEVLYHHRLSNPHIEGFIELLRAQARASDDLVHEGRAKPIVRQVFDRETELLPHAGNIVESAARDVGKPGDVRALMGEQRMNKLYIDPRRSEQFGFECLLLRLYEFSNKAVAVGVKSARFQAENPLSGAAVSSVQQFRAPDFTD